MSFCVLYDTPRLRIPWYRVGGAPAPLAAYQPKGAASLAASYTNLVTPGTYNAAPGVAPTFNTATGWTFDGLTTYLTTGLTPANNQSWSMLVRFANATTANGCLAGMLTSSATRSFALFHRIDALAANSVAYANGGYVAVSPLLNTGVLAICGAQGYRNGVSDGAACAAWTGAASGPIIIGARNSGTPGPTPGLFYGGDIIAMAIWNQNVAAYAAALYAAVAAL